MKKAVIIALSILVFGCGSSNDDVAGAYGCDTGTFIMVMADGMMFIADAAFSYTVEGDRILVEDYPIEDTGFVIDGDTLKGNILSSPVVCKKSSS